MGGFGITMQAINISSRGEASRVEMEVCGITVEQAESRIHTMLSHNDSPRAGKAP